MKLRFGNRRCRLPTSSVGASQSALGAAMVFFLSALVAPAATGQSADSTSAPSSDSGKVAEIIVTAQRRSESLQNTPVAATAITGDALAAQHINNLSNISAVTPSVGFQSTNNAQATANLEIRGIAPRRCAVPPAAISRALDLIAIGRGVPTLATAPCTLRAVSLP